MHAPNVESHVNVVVERIVRSEGKPMVLHQEVPQSQVVGLAYSANSPVIHLLDLSPISTGDIHRQGMVVLDTLRGYVQASLDLPVSVVSRTRSPRSLWQHRQDGIVGTAFNSFPQFFRISERNQPKRRLDSLIPKGGFKVLFETCTPLLVQVGRPG